jgi:ABC-2 type transport system ATP-binding protein
VIALRDVSARRRPVSLRNVTVDWGPGIHAVVGTQGDGCSLLLAVIVGAAQARAGQVRILERSPTDPQVRAQVARVALEPSLPEALRVDETFDLAARLRRDPPGAAKERLAVLGLEALAPRSVRSLSRGEARGVALAEALTSPRVRVLVVEEPFAASDARAAGRLVDGLRRKSESGCAIVMSTASLRDAGELADDYVLLRAGALVGATTSVQALATLGVRSACLVIVARDGIEARRLVAALATESDVTGAELEANTVKVHGANPMALAGAAARASTEAGVDVIEIRPELVSLAEARP